MSDLLRLVLPVLAAFATAFAIDALSVQRQLQAPAFRRDVTSDAGLRRSMFLFLFSIGLFLTVFQSVAMFGVEIDVDYSQVQSWQLFWVHGLLIATMAAWFLLGFARLPSTRGRLLRESVQQFRLSTKNVGTEIALGFGVGLAGWLVVITIVATTGMVLTSLGETALLPTEVPSQIVWMASLSFPLRFMIAVSAGVVEELFFRGFLQPRIGIAFSCVLFILAHMSYGQPFLLFGVTLLSIGFALLSRWRGNIWAAITAHFVFDAVQLLILIPSALQAAGTAG